MKQMILTLCVLLSPLCGTAQDFNCYTVIAGCRATEDGSVLMAHNEDDGGEQMLNWYRVPALQHSDRYMLFRNGGREQLSAQTNGYLWLELPKMEVSDGYLNDKGVAIVSDGCPSKEKHKDFTDGGVVYEVREMVARLAVSARHAVEIIGRMVEKYGYADSGRSYCVADSKEAWVVAVVQGRHWVAQRVPDDCVMALPNSYTIDRIDLSDTQNFAGSADIIDYATERGWYNPATDGTFSFRKAYAAKGSYDHIDNILRAWLPVCLLSGRDYPKTAEGLPFSFQPAKKVSLQTMMDVLSSHYHPEPLKTEKADALHGTRGSICHNDSQYGAVFQLRSNMPVETGAVAWIAPYNPCMQVFVPWYIGMNKIPADYSRYAGYAEALEKHFVDTQGFKEKYPDKAYWKYCAVSEQIRADYGVRKAKIKSERERLQQQLLKQQPSFEKRMNQLYKKDKNRCSDELSAYTAEWLQKTMFTPE